MEYIYGYSLPVEFLKDNTDLQLWYPITDGDHGCIYQIGRGIPLYKLLAKLEYGDSLISDKEHINRLYDLFDDCFEKRPAFWSGDAQLEFVMA